jgi:hypothetical protein
MLRLPVNSLPLPFCRDRQQVGAKGGLSMESRKLSPQDRSALFRVLAYEARRRVDETTGSVRDSWAVVERQWETLASKAGVDAAAESEDHQTLFSASRLMVS